MTARPVAVGDDGAWGSPDARSWTKLATTGGSGFTTLGVGPAGVLAIGDEVWTGPASAVP